MIGKFEDHLVTVMSFWSLELGLGAFSYKISISTISSNDLPPRVQSES